MVTRIITGGDRGGAAVTQPLLTRLLSILVMYMVMMVTVVTVLGGRLVGAKIGPVSCPVRQPLRDRHLRHRNGATGPSPITMD